MSVQTTLEKLITFETVLGNDKEFIAALDWIEDELRGLPLYFTRLESNGVPSLVVTTKKDQKSPKIFLAAHIDVVPGAKEQFKPSIEGDRMYGRGAFDMKYAIACYIEFFKEIGKDLEQYDIGMMITADEETSGENGTNFLMHQGYRCEVMLLPECGTKPWHFETAAKGRWAFRAHAKGQSTHSSRPWDGDNAIDTLTAFIVDVQTLFKKLEFKSDDHWFPTCVTAMIEGGKSANTVASEATVSFDVRYPSARDGELIQREITTFARRYEKVSIETFLDLHPYSFEDEPEMEVYANIVKEKTGIECGHIRNHGTSDARYVYPHGIPVLIIWPEGAGHHAADEWINLDDLERYYDIMKAWIMERGK